ncbi:MAG: FtsB family cell division protein [Rhodospirillaceae bacterium]
MIVAKDLSSNPRPTASLKAGQIVSLKASQIIVPLMGAAMLVYFGYHAVQGDRGLIAWWSLRYEIDKADAQLTLVTAEKQALERRVALLRPQSLDTDMLAERAHLMLGAVQGDDLIVPDPTYVKPSQANPQ